jgi:hypothetical protein
VRRGLTPGISPTELLSHPAVCATWNINTDTTTKHEVWLRQRLLCILSVYIGCLGQEVAVEKKLSFVTNCVALTARCSFAWLGNDPVALINLLCVKRCAYR